jgi:NADP-dependent aldehyde dehydrogenase
MSALQGVDPRTGEPASAPVEETSADRLEAALAAAAAAAGPLADVDGPGLARLLRGAGAALGAGADELVATADAETGLGEARLRGELARTSWQFELYARVAEDGSVVEAAVDPAREDFGPLPRPDVRRMLVPRGPVAVFGSSNFPFGFGVAGTDTAAALAAGCPVVAKAHPDHPATAELLGQVLRSGLSSAGAPDGSYAVVHGLDVGRSLVMDPRVRAVAFTGSLRGGRALYDLAVARPEPIPFYGELGSVNPVFVTPAAAAARRDQIARGFVESFTLGTGQFCTKPGLLLVPAGSGLVEAITALVVPAAAGPLLDARIAAAFEESSARRAAAAGVRATVRASAAVPSQGSWAAPVVHTTRLADLGDGSDLLEECFGPSAVIAEYDSGEELLGLADRLVGQLAAGIHAEADDEGDGALAAALLRRLRDRAGRVVWNGWPTGVAVTYAMHHGGPYPATTDAAYTSVGTAAIRRFLRPVCFQGVPDAWLPAALQDRNPLGLTRQVDGALTAT